MSLYYILVDGKVTPTGVRVWSDNFFNSNRTIVMDKFGDDVDISTVFLGIDHSHDGSIPLLFETMVFGGEFDGYMDRYHTIEEAIDGHQKILDMVDGGRTKRDTKLNDLGI